MKYFFLLLVFFAEFAAAVAGGYPDVNCEAYGYASFRVHGNWCSTFPSYEGSGYDCNVKGEPTCALLGKGVEDCMYAFAMEPSGYNISSAYVSPGQCFAASDNDQSDDELCLPLSGDCPELQECVTESGAVYMIAQSKNCDDYCEGTESGFLKFLGCDRFGNSSEDVSHATSGGPEDGSWDCEVQPFMCDYDENGDGQIDDNDDRTTWPDPSDGVGSGSGCIAQGGEACETVEEHQGSDIDGDGAVGESPGVGSDGSTGGSVLNPMDCQDVSLSYCDKSGYQAFGTGWQGSMCHDGPELFVPNRKCDDDYGGEPEEHETKTETLLASLEFQAKEANVSLRSLIASMGISRKEIVEALYQTNGDGVESQNLNANANADRIIAALNGSGEGEGEGIDLNPIMGELTAINEKLGAEVGAGTGKGFDDIQSELTQAKTDFETAFAEVQNGMDGLFAFSGGTSSGLTCDTSFEVLGETYDFCISDYEDELSLIGSGLVALSLIMSVFIMLGGIRV